MITIDNGSPRLWETVMARPAWTCAPGADIVRRMSVRRLAPLLAIAAVIAAVIAAAGCSSVENETPNGIWIRAPFLGIGDPQATADAHCRKYGKTAVYQGRLGATTNPVYVPILAYDCR